MSKRVDPVLQALLSVVEDNDRAESETAFHVPLTVNCGGLLVSGELISRAEYARAVKKKIQIWMEERPAASRPI